MTDFLAFLALCAASGYLIAKLAERIKIKRAWIGKEIRIIGGTGAGQTCIIKKSNKNTLTINKPWTTPPDNSSEFAIQDKDNIP